jgi:hypothetical protein
VDTFEHFKSYGYVESFRKTTATAMWENHSPFVSHCAVQLRHLSGCDAAVVYFEVLISILLLSRVSPQYFLEVFC